MPTPLLIELILGSRGDLRGILKEPVPVLNTRYARARANQAFFQASLVSQNYKFAYYAFCCAASMGRRAAGWGVPNQVNVHSKYDPEASRKLALCSACNSLKLCSSLVVVASTKQLKCLPCAAKYKGLPRGAKSNKGTRPENTALKGMPRGTKSGKGTNPKDTALKGITTAVLQKEFERLGMTKDQKKSEIDEYNKYVNNLAISVDDNGNRSFKDIYFDMERVERRPPESKSPFQVSMDAIDPITLHGTQTRIHVPHNMGPTACEFLIAGNTS